MTTYMYQLKFSKQTLFLIIFSARYGGTVTTLSVGNYQEKEISQTVTTGEVFPYFLYKARSSENNCKQNYDSSGKQAKERTGGLHERKELQ